jgi:hypothetical protein
LKKFPVFLRVVYTKGLQRCLPGIVTTLLLLLASGHHHAVRKAKNTCPHYLCPKYYRELIHR